MPVYKSESYLNRCIDSILAQTYTDWELLLIDDGSPDGSGAICDEYAIKDNRIRVFHKGNGGVSSARNLGIDNVKGEYVTFVDSDDALYSSTLEVLLSTIERNCVDFVQCAFNREYIEGQNNGKDSDRLPADEYIKNGFLGTHVWGSIFKANIIKGRNLRFITNVKLGEDQIFVLDYLFYAQHACYICDALYYYRDNRDSAIHNPKPEYEIESVKAFKELKRRNPLAKMQCDNMLLRWLITLSRSKDVAIDEISDMYSDVTLDYCSPSCRTKQKIIWRLYEIDHKCAIRLVRLAIDVQYEKI